MNHVQSSGRIAGHVCPACSGSGVTQAGQAAQELLKLTEAAQMVAAFQQLDYDGRTALASLDIEAYRMLNNVETMRNGQ